MTQSSKMVLVIDDDEHSLRCFARDLAALNIRAWTARTFEIAHEVLTTRAPSHIVSEVRVAGRWLFDYINGVAPETPATRFIVATAYPSVATAVQLTQDRKSVV